MHRDQKPVSHKHTTTKVDMELEVIKAVGEGLKNMCSSMQQQQPQAAKEENCCLATKMHGPVKESKGKISHK